MSLPLSPPVFSILAALVEERAGLHYGQSDLELFAQKVGPRVEEAGFDSFLDYYYFLRYDPEGVAAISALVEALTVHETYFFRELDALEAVVQGVLLPAISRGERPRVWCAACSTGEEPLSLAMMLAKEGALPQVELHASDVSAPILDRARRGEFGSRSLRALPPGFLGTLLHQDGDRVIVDAAVREAVRWRQINLVNEDEVGQMGKFDVILCRNVLIYFSDATAVRVVGLLASALREGGWLVVGTSESLLRFGTALQCVQIRGAFFYGRAPR